MNERLLTCLLLGEAAFVSTAAVAICGATVGAASMLLYGRLSPQARVAQLTARIAEARSALYQDDGSDMRAVWSTARHALSLSLQQIGLILVPTFCAVLLVISLAWLVDTAFHLAHLSVAPNWRPAWLFSGHALFWLPLTGAALSVKWILGIK